MNLPPEYPLDELVLGSVKEPKISFPRAPEHALCPNCACPAERYDYCLCHTSYHLSGQCAVDEAAYRARQLADRKRTRMAKRFMVPQ